MALEDPDELKRAQEEAKAHGADKYKLKNVIRRYIDTFRSIAKWGRTKQTTLEFLERHSIGEEDSPRTTNSTGCGPSSRDEIVVPRFR